MVDKSTELLYYSTVNETREHTMTIYHLFCSTCSDQLRRAIGDRYFADYAHAEAARNEYLAGERDKMRLDARLLKRSVHPESAPSGADCIHLVGTIRLDRGRTCETLSPWYEIEKIVTED